MHMLLPENRSFLTVCLNPVIQRTVVLDGFVKGEVNRSSAWRVDAAGKGVCCARVLAQTGRRAIHLTALGGPARGWFLDLCESDGVRVEWVESGSNPRFCTTLIDGSDATATELIEEGRPVDAGTAVRLLAAFDALLPEAAAVLITGTKAPGYPPDILPRITAMARAWSIPVSIDLKGPDLLACLEERPLVAKPNLEELLSTFATGDGSPVAPGPGDEEAVRAFVAGTGKLWHKRYGTFLVITRGSRSTLYWNGERLEEEPVERITPVNPIGSGDSFHAGLMASLVGGSSLAEAVREGTRLGARNAEQLKPGSIVPD